MARHLHGVGDGGAAAGGRLRRELAEHALGLIGRRHVGEIGAGILEGARDAAGGVRRIVMAAHLTVAAVPVPERIVSSLSIVPVMQRAA